MKIFIAGCFDLLHEGHLHLLKTAKNLDDKNNDLIVAINCDEDVRRRKGAFRPIHSQEVRVFYLMETELVHQVIVFNGDNELLEIIKSIKPDIIVVGDDYTEDKIVGAKECKFWGGRVEIVKKIPNISTTKIIENKQWEEKTLNFQLEKEDSTY